MTKRLYYADSYTTEFDVLVQRVEQTDAGSALVLNETHFYPTSGGQPHDLGTIGRLNVVDVVAADNGDILHVVDAQIPSDAVGAVLHCAVDWERRYDLMQQHSGQHLLSATFAQLFGHETVSVHFGATESTLDLDTPRLSDFEIEEAQRFADTMVFSNLPIRSYFVDEDEIGRLPLRRPPQVIGEIRVVEIDNFDWSACGGTHVRATGEIGPVKIVKQERRKETTRLTFLCGWRSIRDHHEKHELLTNAAALFSNDYRQVPELIERALEQAKTKQRQIDDLTDRLLHLEAEQLARTAEQVGGVSMIVHLFDDKDANDVRVLASQLRENPVAVVLLASTAGEKVAAVFARGDDIDLHAGKLLRLALQEYGGGGGGRPDLAQGGGIAPEQAQAMLDFARTQAEAELR